MKRAGLIKQMLRSAAIIAITTGLLLHFAPSYIWHDGFLPNAIAATRSCTGGVQHVIDGDTVWMHCRGYEIKVRLDYIDAPEVAHPYWNEPGQPGGEQARSELISLIAGRPVTLQPTGRDEYGRTLGVLSVDGMNLNLAMVRDGWAWAYTRYTKARYREAQRRAKAAHRGLWSLPSRHVPPWIFRHTHDGH